MKSITLLSALTILSINSICQEIFHNARFVNIKQTENGFVSIIKGANDDKLKKFLVKKYEGYYTEGIAFHNTEGHLIWVLVFEDRLIFDVMLENDKVLVLNADWHGSKINSSAELYETELSLKGKRMREKKITYIKSDVPNSRIHGFYDSQGRIWEWVNWERKEDILINDREVRGGKEDNIRISCHLNGTSYSNLITGKNLRVLTHDVFSTKIGFIISGSEVYLNEKAFNADEKVLIEFNTSGNLTKAKSIALNNVFIEYLQFTETEIFIGGSFQGNDTLKFEPTAYLLEKPLNSPKNTFRDETARNGFVASLSDSFSLNWVQTFYSDHDVSIESMSVQNDTVIVCIRYKDLVKIDKKQITSLKDSSRYEYSDAALVVFSSKGNLNSFERVIGNGYEKIEAYLRGDKLILVGSFLYSMKVFDIELNDPSKNSCNYLIFKEKHIVKKARMF